MTLVLTFFVLTVFVKSNAILFIEPK